MVTGKLKITLTSALIVCILAGLLQQGQALKACADDSGSQYDHSAVLSCSLIFRIEVLDAVLEVLSNTVNYKYPLLLLLLRFCLCCRTAVIGDIDSLRGSSVLSSRRVLLIFR